MLLLFKSINMRAIECLKYGAAENLILKELSKPQPKQGEVLIKIEATAVTTSDVLIRSLNEAFIPRLILQMIFGFGKPRNPILGMVSAGTIEKLGSGVKSFKVGDEVFAYGSLSPTKRRFGSYAEYICLPEDWNLALKPQGLSFQEAAALPYGGLLAKHLLSKTKIKKGDKVLIYGASGSIGTMLIQLAKLAGAEITAVCSEANFELVKSLGSDRQIDYRNPSAIHQLESYQYVFDAVGNSKSSILKEEAKKSLHKGGKYISIDQGTPLTPKEAFLNLKTLAESGVLKPVIDRVYPLEEIVQAHQYVETGRKRGNVVISI